MGRGVPAAGKAGTQVLFIKIGNRRAGVKGKKKAPAGTRRTGAIRSESRPYFDLSLGRMNSPKMEIARASAAMISATIPKSINHLNRSGRLQTERAGPKGDGRATGYKEAPSARAGRC